MKTPEHQIFPDGTAVVFNQHARQAMRPSSAIQHPLETPAAGVDAVYTVTNTDDSFHDVILNETQQRYGVAWLEPAEPATQQTEARPQTLIIIVSNLADTIQSAAGPVSLVGDHGGQSLITGDIRDSGLVMGALSVETEHGTVYLDPDAEQEISTEQPDPEEVEDDEDRAQRAVTEYRGTLLGHLELVASLWNTEYGSLTITTTPDDGRIFTFVTGGWSENETLISALEGSFLTHTLTWMKSERGGLHDYSVEPSLFKLHIGS